MQPITTQHFQTQNLRIAYDDCGKNSKTIILLHGLTTNKQSFDGLLRAGLAEQYRVIRIDLRGRGLSDKPETGYHMQDHADDVIALIHALNLQDIILIGHSFGGLIAVFLVANYPSLFSRLVLLDVGVDATYPAVLDRVDASLRFLQKTIKSWNLYMRLIKKSAFFADGYWDDDLEAAYRADVEILDDGQVRPLAHAVGMQEAANLTVIDDWKPRFSAIECPVLLLHSTQILDGILPMMSDEGAAETRALLKNSSYQRVSGNHISMLFGSHAQQVVRAIYEFIAAKSS